MRSRYNRIVQRMKDKMKAKNQEKDAAAEECIMTPEQQHQRDFLDAMAYAKLWTPNTPNRNGSSWRDIVLSGRWIAVDEQHADVAYAEPTEFLEKPIVRFKNRDDISFFQKVYYGPHQEGYVKLEEIDIQEGDDNALNAYLGVVSEHPGK